MKNTDVASYHASRFAVNSRMDLDDLEQEALLAVWLAETDGRYDPEKASLRTYCSIRAYRDLCTITERHKRRNPITDELGDDLIGAGPTPEDTVMFLELVRQLPEDARLLAETVLRDVAALAGLTPTTARRIVTEKMAWPMQRVRAAVAAITDALRPEDELESLLLRGLSSARWSSVGMTLRKRRRVGFTRKR